MKFTISNSELVRGVKSVAGVVKTNNTLPILDDILLEVVGSTMILSATDLETTIQVAVKPEKTDGAGSIAIPAKILLDTLKTFSGVELVFSIEPETGLIEITAGGGSYKITGHNAAEYPKTPQVDNTKEIGLDSGLLYRIIQKTIFAAGDDELRAILSGVLFDLSPGGTTFVATDAHKLVKYHTDYKFDDVQFIVPKRALGILCGVLQGRDVPVAIEYNNINVVFSFDNVKMTCRLIDGKYPDYAAVIPTENPNRMIVGREELLKSISRIALFSNDATHQIKFGITGGGLTISSENMDYGQSATEHLDCQYSGEDLEIGFNAKIMSEALKNIDAEMVTVDMSTPNKAAILHPAEGKEDLLILVMPLMIR